MIAPHRARALPALLSLAFFLASPRIRAAEDSGLRWVGDARVAASSGGALLGGPALRFRYGTKLLRRSKAEGAVDFVVGSWGGAEVSAGLLLGAVDSERYGSLTVLGVRPWLSRWQNDWFLRTERWSVLGALIPEVGLTVGLPRAPRLHLGWELPLGGQHVHVVPGVLWIAPGRGVPLLCTLALRVTM